MPAVRNRTGATRCNSRSIALEGRYAAYRLAFTRQQLDTTVTSARTGEVLEQRSGHDQSFTVDADTHFRIHGCDVWGTFYFAHASRFGVPDPRAQNELGMCGVLRAGP